MEVAAPIQLKGPRRLDVALSVCALLAVLAALLQPELVVVLLPALFGAAWLRYRDGRLQALSLDSGHEVVLYGPDGAMLHARLMHARMNRHALSLELAGVGHRRRRLLLTEDRFVRPDDFRRLRRVVREGLRDDVPGAASGWSAWRSRWFPDSHG